MFRCNRHQFQVSNILKKDSNLDSLQAGLGACKTAFYRSFQTLEVIPPASNKETIRRRGGRYEVQEKKMDEYVVVLNSEEEDTMFMNGVFFCCFSCVCAFGLLYRAWVHVNTGPARYTFLKLIKM